MTKIQMTNDERKTLKACLELTKNIEERFTNPLFLSAQLPELFKLLETFSQSLDVNLQKLSLIPGHLHPQMERRHFLNFVIPIERALGRNLSDDQFLITRDDRQAEKDLSPLPRAPLVFVLENLRSAFNVGSIFRLADCLCASEIHLVGYTMTPEQTANEAQPNPLHKTSLGATKTVPWKSWTELSSSLQDLRARGFELIALETAKNSQSLFDFRFHKPTAFIVGNERYGLEPSSLGLCDQIISIPSWGMKNSLNVSQALAIGAYEWRRQWK